MTFSNKRSELFPALATLCLLWVASAAADEVHYRFDGHGKARLLGQAFPDDSASASLTDSPALGIETDLRLNFEVRKGPWSMQTAYQLFALRGDRIEYSRDPAATGLSADRLPSDRRRLFGLTDVIRDEGKSAALQRLDRLSLGYTGENTVLRAGRQAISWGNGFFFAPMDIVNPFNPTAIDTEYKSGDDMLYAQYLKSNGHDLQAALVFRRNSLSGEIESDEGTVAARYHGVAGDREFDVLVADSYGSPTLGIGANRSVGGAVWRGDIVVSREGSEATLQFVTNIDYSWNWRGRNMSGVVEYYYSGFGIKGGRYDEHALAGNPELLQKFARGELFTLGRNYLAAGVTVEMTPLWTLTPNVYANLDDQSALIQLLTQYSLGDNLAILGALSVPFGPDGSEYGGIEAGATDEYLSVGFALFAQLAWYF